jgi:hypothetical protein
MMMMKPWQTRVIKAPNKAEKKRNKERDPSLSLKDKTQSELLRGKRTNHVSILPFVAQSI